MGNGRFMKKRALLHCTIVLHEVHALGHHKVT